MLALCFTILSIPRVPTTTQPLQAVRLATDVDLPRIAQLQLDVFDPLPEAPPAASKPSLFASLMGGGSSPERIAKQRRERAERLTTSLGDRMAQGSDLYIVEAEAEDGLVLVGSADLSEQEMMLPSHAIAEGLYLSSMAVDASFRRRGIGRMLLRRAVERAEERGAECIWLHVEKANGAALTLYQADGFAKQAETPRHAAFTSALELQQYEPMLFCKRLTQ